MSRTIAYEVIRADYTALWGTVTLNSGTASFIRAEAQELIDNRPRYDVIEKRLGVPWYFVAVTHSLECGLRFDRHLHNGDPLTARTRLVPKGRPKNGKPPFTWEESAVDALSMKGLHKLTDWSIERTLYELERYNGFGYRLYHPEVKSPYLWSMTNHYRRGKYVADGKWSSTAVSKQVGAAALLLVLKSDHGIKL